MQNFQLFSQVSKKYYHLVHSRDYWLPLIKEQFPFVGVDTYISRPDCDWAHIFRSLELTYYGTFSHKTALLFYYTKRNDLRSIKLLNVTLDMLREEDSYGMKAAHYAMLAGHQNILDYFYQTLILQLTDIPGSIQHNFMQLYHAIYCRQPIDKIKALFQQQIDLHHPDDYATLLGEQRQLYKAAMTQSDTKVFLWLQHSSTPFYP